MIKYYRFIIVFITLLLPIAIFAQQVEQVHDNFKFEIIDGQFVTITWYGGNTADVIIPASIQGLPVTTIGRAAFWNLEGRINSLTSITIPSSVTTIGDYAFFSCDRLTDINVDAKNDVYMSIAGVLFDKNQQTLICYPAGKNGAYTIPSSVTTIGDSAFLDCERLTSIIIPSSVISIGKFAFAGCSSLNHTSIDIPLSVTSIGDRAFSGISLTNVTLSRGTNIGDKVFNEGVQIQYID